MRVLTGLGRGHEAVETGLRYLQICEQEQLLPGHVAQATTAALIAVGQPEQAAAMAEQLISNATVQGVTGIMLGSLLELRAQAAAASGDDAGLREWVERCSKAYHVDRNPAL